MSEDKRDKEFEVEELSDANLEGVSGGVESSGDIISDAPGNNCTNNAVGC